ncbi:hypothetical protein FLM48_11030 [Shewanella sp. Scap07]|uniref:hypothetical protein n=1 Tax=Shewanella sp. Scap07 TaxID=2589987 RepID=UPI0015BDC6EC|nr:hypothetical protein [Shewanella sp. Scap07]QLE85563.1 hypothetical protein FLM48_11030 [Shewanella sp. Scap07]
MNIAKSVAQLPQALSKGQGALIAVAVIYSLYTLHKMYGAGDRLANAATKPLGQMWSDASGWLNGYKPVELTDLVIQPWYLDADYHISAEAWDILSKDAGYKAIMLKIFDGRTLKPEYRDLIGKPIGGV